MSDESDFDIMDPAVQQCPYEGYKQLRRTAPLYQSPSTGFHLVTQYDLAREIIRAPDAFPSSVSPMALSDDGLVPETPTIEQSEAGCRSPHAQPRIPLTIAVCGAF